MKTAVLVLGILGGVLGIAAAIFLLALGSIVGSKHKLPGILMIVSAIEGLIFSAAYLFPAPFLLVGGILALFARKPKPNAEMPEGAVVVRSKE